MSNVVVERLKLIRAVIYPPPLPYRPFGLTFLADCPLIDSLTVFLTRKSH